MGTSSSAASDMEGQSGLTVERACEAPLSVSHREALRVALASRGSVPCRSRRCGRWDASPLAKSRAEREQTKYPGRHNIIRNLNIQGLDMGPANRDIVHGKNVVAKLRYGDGKRPHDSCGCLAR